MIKFATTYIPLPKQSFFLKNNQMKKILYLLAALFILSACTQRSNDSAKDKEGKPAEITFVEAHGYFFKNNQDSLASSKITTREEFDKYFGAATVMGEKGKPTEIDFGKSFVIACVMPETDVETELKPVSVGEISTRPGEHTGKYGCLFSFKKGEKQSFTIRPVSIIILDREFVDIDFSVFTAGEEVIKRVN